MYDREIELWTVRLAGGRKDLRACERVLSADEQQRAGAFHFAHLKERFTFARGVLRVLVAYYLHTAPFKLQFAYGAAGKPRVEVPATDLTFNLSHSDEMALYAFTRACEIGVDIEQARTISEPIDIKDWTRKEAYLKAGGEGWSIDTSTAFTMDGWTLHELTPAPGYTAALAYQGSERPLRWHPIMDASQVIEAYGGLFD